MERFENKEKKTLLQRIKKPLFAAILTAGLMVVPTKGAESSHKEFLLNPPLEDYCIDYSKTRWKYPFMAVRNGWRMLYDIKLDAREIPEKIYFKFAKEFYENEVKKENKTKHEIITDKYLNAWLKYISSALHFYDYRIEIISIRDTGEKKTITEITKIDLGDNIEKMENGLLEVLKIVNERLKEAPDDIHYNIMRFTIYYNLFEAYSYMLFNELDKKFYNLNNLTPEKSIEKSLEYGEEFIKRYNENKLKKSKIYICVEEPKTISEESIENIISNLRIRKEIIEYKIEVIKELMPKGKKSKDKNSEEDQIQKIIGIELGK